MNIANQLYLVSNSTGHVSYMKNETTRKLVFQESAAFLESIICRGPVNASARLWNHLPEISVYPNPFVDILNIETEAKIQAITVNNLIGQTYLDLSYPSDYLLDLSKLPKGLYLIRLRTDQGISVFKVVKE